MKKGFLALAFISLGFSNSFGQMQNMATASDTDTTLVLQSAKKVAVFIELGPPAAARYLPDFARAKKQVNEKLSKAKLQVVANPSDADIVIVVHELNEGSINGEFKDDTCLGDKLDVFRGGKAPVETDIPIFSVNEYCGFSWPLNRDLDQLIKVMKR